MTSNLIDRFNLFIEQENVEEINGVWSMQSNKFKDFWKNKIMDPSYPTLSDSEIDEIILILDKKARGSTRETYAVANTMIPQGVWGILFSQIKESNPLKDHLNRLFHSENEEEKINLINEIYKINEGKKNSLTGKSGNAMNCMLFAYSPPTYLAIISLNDRQKIIKHYGINSSLDFEKDSPGRKIIVSNNEILDWFRNNIMIGSPMILTRFTYLILKNEWKPIEEIEKTEFALQEQVEYSKEKSVFYMEKELENFLIRNWNKTEFGSKYELIEENGEVVSQQYRIDIGTIDILAIDKKNGQYVVIELKRDQTSDDTVGQITRYMGWIQENKAGGKAIKGIIIAAAYDPRLYYSLRIVNNVEVYLYEVDFKLKEFKKIEKKTSSGTN